MDHLFLIGDSELSIRTRVLSPTLTFYNFIVVKKVIFTVKIQCVVRFLYIISETMSKSQSPVGVF